MAADVTERRLADAELRQRERQLEHTQRLAHLGSWQWEIAADTVTWSDELYRIYGLEPQSFAPTFGTYFSRVHPDDRAAVKAHLEEATRAGSVFDFVERIVRPTGEVRVLRSQGEVVRDDMGAPVRLVGACHDITEQEAARTALLRAEAVLKQSHDELERLVEARTAELAQTNIALEEEIAERERAEEELRQRSAELEAVFRALPDLYFRLDSDGTILDHRSGRGSSDVIPTEACLGRRIQDVLPGDARALMEAGLARVSRSAHLIRFEYALPSGDGDGDRDLEARVLPLLGDQAIVVVRDITDQKQAERALRKSEEHFRRIIENASDFASILGPDGVNRYQSPAIQHIMGYTPEEVVGTSALDRIHPDDAPACREVLQWIAQHPGEIRSAEFRYRHKDGSWRVIEARARTLLPDSAAQGIVVNNREVTERKRHEVALRQAVEAAELANRAKSDFLSRMSHELRTPMNSILGFGQLIARKELPPDQRKGIEHILKAGTHLLNLINEVLEISSIEAGRQTLSLEPVHVAGVVQEARSLIQPLAAQGGLTLDEFDIPPGLHVHADRQRLVQILLNLLSNAVKYNRPAGHVSVVCEERLLPDSSRSVAIGVRDTGAGIAPELIDRLFVPFERLGAGQSDVEGTGLGLALSKRLVDAMGGTLTLETRVGEGSTFWVALAASVSPIAAADRGSAGAAGTTGPPPDAVPATILYIEDNLPNLTLVHTILNERPAVTLLSALQGQLGFDLAVEHRPDLILLDMHLPDLRGEEVLRRLDADDRTRGIPVVVVSADATAASVDRLLAAGAAAYLTKPLDVADFLATVDRLLPPSRDPGHGS